MVVLDASALLALLGSESGSEKVAERVVGGAVISAVNHAEVAAKLADWGVPDEDIREALDGLNLRVVPFDEELAYLSGSLRRRTRKAGLSLGDRACLAFAQRAGLPVLTADRSWENLVPDVALEWVR